MIRLLARTAFLLSGVAGLTFEIVWLRHLGWAVGATTLAVATTTAAYMGGLALGSHLAGRLADHLRRPLAVYGAIEIGLALFGLGVPWLCRQIPRVDAAWFADVDSGLGRALTRFLVAMAVLIIPTTAMGMTLPILARAVTDRVGRVGREVGLLYAINLTGAMLGAALAGFALLPTLGLAATNLVAVGLDIALGLLALLGGLFLDPVQPPAPTAASTPVLREGSGQLVAILVVTGAAAMALQVLWTRALGTALGPSTYAFSAIVCTYLAGLALGGMLASWLADQLVTARLALAGVLIFTGLMAVIGIALVDDLPILLMRVVLNPQLTMGGLLQSEFGLAALSVLPATLGMGAIFPLTLSAVVGNEATIGQAVGRAYALNTVGNILGSFAGVFILLPLLGVEWGMRIAALCYLLVALALCLKLEPSVRPLHKAWAVGVGVFGVIVCLGWPGWDVPRWTAGTFRMSMTRNFFSDGNFSASKLIFHKDGLATTVTVEEEQGVRWIKVNGKIDGSSEGDMPTQVLSGLLPMLFHPAPREVAVIGCGSGVTVGAALTADPEHLTLIELEREVVEAAALFEAVNHLPWKDPRVTVATDDGRNFMARARAPFDVIISEPSNPWMTGAASLFTQEFFKLAAQRLQDDGLFLQWLQIYELAPDRIASVLKTFQSVFPNVLVFTPKSDSNDLLMLGSRTPITIDWQALGARFDKLKPEMTRAELQSPEDLLALLLFSNTEIQALPERVPLNTDDNAYIEFGAPRDLLAFAEDDPEVKPIEMVRGKRTALIARLSSPLPDAWPLQVPKLARAYLRQGMVADAHAAAAEITQAKTPMPAEAIAAANAVGEIAYLLKEDEREVALDEAAALEDRDYAQVAALVAADQVDEAAQILEKAPELSRRSSAHAFLAGYVALHKGQTGRAHSLFSKVQSDSAYAALHPAVSYFLAKASFETGEYARAVSEMEHYQAARRTEKGPAISAVRLSPANSTE